MVDTELIAQELRTLGHTVEAIIDVPSNAGSYEFRVDGRILSLEEARALLEHDFKQ